MHSSWIVHVFIIVASWANIDDVTVVASAAVAASAADTAAAGAVDAMLLVGVTDDMAFPGIVSQLHYVLSYLEGSN